MRVLVSHWRQLLKRSHAIWLQLLQMLLGALTLIDPTIILQVWNMMPSGVAARVPENFVSWVGAFLFAWAMLTVLARLWRQPKLQAKIQERENG